MHDGLSVQGDVRLQSRLESNQTSDGGSTTVSHEPCLETQYLHLQVGTDADADVSEQRCDAATWIELPTVPPTRSPTLHEVCMGMFTSLHATS